jgi:hypothetical protein
MFRADGLGIRKNDDGTVAGKVRVFRDDVQPAKALFDQEFTGKDVADIATQVSAVLAKLHAAETDVDLNKQFVGVTIARL